MKELFGLLLDLAAFVSPSGQETPLADHIASLCKAAGAEVEIDTLGSVIARKMGIGKKVMLCAHMDTIGMMATFIEEGGFIRFCNIGGLTRSDILFAPVVFANGTRGIIGQDDAPKEADRRLSNLFIDIGAKSADEAKKLVSPGDTAVFASPPFVSGRRAYGAYMDNRIGVAVLLRLLDEMGSCENDLYFVFSAQEEVGLRGAKTAAYAIDPDFGFAVDVTDTGDNPDPKPKMAVRLGDGPTIKIMDRSVICHPEAVDALVHAAEQNKIPYQREVLEAGGTDAGAIHTSRAGVKTGAVSIPSRYIHTPAECIDLDDAENAVKLLKAMLEKGLK